MKLVFIDETKQGDSFCVSMVIIDSSKYSILKREYLGVLEKYGWNHKSDKNEFKGKIVFSAKDPEESSRITVDTRIKICNELLEHTLSSGKSKRMDVSFFSDKVKEGRTWQDIYFDVVPKLIEKKLGKGKIKGGKNCVAIFCDSFDMKRKEEMYQKMRRQIATVLRKRNWIFFEEIFFYKSTNYTLGITYADIIGYLVAKKDSGTVHHEAKRTTIDALLDNLKKIDKFKYKE